MAVRVGFLGVAHMHAEGYVEALRQNLCGRATAVWDSDGPRRDRFAVEHGLHEASSPEDLFERCDAVIVCSSNTQHARDVELAANAGKAILCEKPLVTSDEEAVCMRSAVESAGVKFMTAFPCRLAPGWIRLKERVRAGDIGEVRAVCATNRGKCPFDWFVDPSLSGGGAMIDHTVHVADLLRDLLQIEPETVEAQTGSNMHGQPWEDTAMLTLQYSGGAFATIDSSWSRPKSFKTWGDVTMSVVGESGVVEMDLFSQEVQVWSEEPAHSVAYFGSSLDALLVGEFLAAVEEDRQPIVSLEDGLAASRVALAGYRSVQAGQPVAL